MKYHLSENTLIKLSEFLALNLGLFFPKGRWNDLERNIEAASLDFGYNETQMFVEHILTNPLNSDLIEILTAHFTNNETYFLREGESFEALEKSILPELIYKRNEEKKIKIWSAGCSSGEEAYSIAIAVSRLLPDLEDWDITIIATDINPRILNKAIAGTYTNWSFRSVPIGFKEKYFISKGNNKFEIIPEIKKMVKFEYLNLAEDVFPSPINNTNAVDIIFCRNVLMYFDNQNISKVISKLYKSLIVRGYLAVSASEYLLLNNHGFKPVNFTGTVFYMKGDPKYEIEQKTVNDEKIVEPTYNTYNPIIDEEEYIAAQAIVHENELLEPIEISLTKPSDYEAAILLYQKGNYAEVITILNKDNQTKEEQILYIRACTNNGNVAEALRVCEDAIIKNKIDSCLYYLQALILIENNQLTDAATALKRAIYLDPNFVMSYYSLGNIYKQLGEIYNSRKCYENALNILNKCSGDEILKGSEGVTAARLKEIIYAAKKMRFLK